MVTEDLIESINESRLIIENLDTTGAMTIGFNENEMYNLSGKELQMIAKALYLSDCLICDLIQSKII